MTINLKNLRNISKETNEVLKKMQKSEGKNMEKPFTQRVLEWLDDDNDGDIDIADWRTFIRKVLKWIGVVIGILSMVTDFSNGIINIWDQKGWYAILLIIIDHSYSSFQKDRDKSSFAKQRKNYRSKIYELANGYQVLGQKIVDAASKQVLTEVERDIKTNCFYAEMSANKLKDQQIETLRQGYELKNIKIEELEKQLKNK